MSDSTNAEQATEFAQAWAEGQDQSQPSDEGRSELPEEDKSGAEPAGTDTDAVKDPPADGDQTLDAERPAEGSENSDDDLAGLPEAVLKRLREAEERASRAENTLKSNEGRFSRAERERNEVLLRLQRLERETTEKAAPDKGAAPAVSDEELDRVAEEYSDVGKPLVETIKALRGEVAALQQDRTKSAETAEKEAELRLQETYAAEEQKLAGLHADWREVCASEEFGAWLQGQPNAIRQAVLKNAEKIVDAEDGAFALDLFKASRKPADPEQKRREQQLDAGAHIPVRQPALQPTGRGGGDYDSEWERLDREATRKGQGKR